MRRPAPTRFIRARLAAGAVAAMCFAMPAVAALSPELAEKRAKIYKEAWALFDDRKWHDAAEKFKRVIAIQSAARPWIALGHCELKRGSLLLARQDFERARAEAKRAGSRDLVKAADDQLAQLARVIPLVVLRLPRGSGAVTVKLDGRPVRVADGKLQVDPGGHLIQVSSDAGVYEERIQATKASRRIVRVSFVSVEEPSEKTDDGGDFPVGPVVLGAAGVVVAGVGVGFWMSGAGDRSTLDADCEANGCIWDEWSSESAVQDADRDILLGQWGLGIGLTAVAGGVLWWALSADDAGTENQVGMAFSVAPLPGGGHVGAFGSF